jgi:hypothetical protein
MESGPLNKSAGTVNRPASNLGIGSFFAWTGINHVEERRSLVEAHNEVIQIRSSLDDCLLEKNLSQAHATEVREHDEGSVRPKFRGKPCFQNLGGILATYATLLEILWGKGISIPVNNRDH